MHEQAVFAVVLGIMQDAGLPHIGCGCQRCISGRVEQVSCLGLVDTRAEPPGVWLFDATPDISAQLGLLGPWLGPDPGRPDRLRQPTGLFLTHAHMGHTAGLPQLGPEGMAVRRMPVYGPDPLLDQLAAMPLWAPLLAHLALKPLPPGVAHQLGPDLAVTPLPVPHRDEIGAGTYAYHIAGPTRSLLFVPDIDSWHAWPAAGDWLAQSDIALADASFYGPHELGERQPAHPIVPETVAFFAEFEGELLLTHLNHTNPLLDADSPERAAITAAGAAVAREGSVIRLDV
jgi:pyrroloquinoline quinone biosynthesis protein B